MKRSASDTLLGVRGRVLLTILGLGVGTAHAAEPPPPPEAQGSAEPEPALVAVDTRARSPEPEAETVKVRIDGEYELRQSVLTNLPLAPMPGAPARLEQTSRLYHWLRLRPLLLVGRHLELYAEADVPRGMILGGELEDVPQHGTDFDDQQPVRLQLRVLRATLRSALGEATLGHTTTSWGMGLVDSPGDGPRFLGTPQRPATFERVELQSGQPSSLLRVFATADAALDDGPLSLLDGDQLLRVALGSRFRPARRAELGVFARYEALRSRDERGGAQGFVIDSAGSFRTPIAGTPGVAFGSYEVAYRVGDVSEPTAFAGLGGARQLTAAGGAFELGVALERTDNHERYGFLVTSLEWGMASGDADPTDSELHRFVMNPNHGVGLILFSEVLRFKSARAQALLSRQSPRAGAARLAGLSTSGGVAGAAYVNPRLLLRPWPDLDLKLGVLVASATTEVVDPSALAGSGTRANFDGGSPRGRSLGSELDAGALLRVRLDPPMELRLSLEGGVAFLGSAFADADGERPAPQALATAGLGLTF